MSPVYYLEDTYNYDVYKKYTDFPISFKNSIIVNCDFQQDLQNVIFELGSIKNQQRDKKIVFEQRREGSQIDTKRVTNQIVTELINNFNCELNDFIILNGTAPSQYNADLLKAYDEQHGLLPIKTIFANTMEMQLGISLQDDRVLEYKFDFSKKTKDFLLYIGKMDSHRMYLLSNLLRLNLLSNSYYSCYFRPDLIDLIQPNYYPLYMKQSLEHIKSMVQDFPIKLRAEDSFDKLRMWDLNKEEKYHYDHSFLAIIPETNFYHIEQNPHEPHTRVNQVFITEKTYRIIAGKLPFIMVGFTKSLEVLRESGYQTFHPYIDESYDLIENDQDRLDAIIAEIKRFSEFSPMERKKWAEKIIPIVDHNQKVLLSCSPKYLEVY
jgi:hypothetical protein